jgi:hypothetical protein
MGWSFAVIENVTGVAGVREPGSLSCGLGNCITNAPRLPMLGNVMEFVPSESAPSLTWMIV